MADIVSKDSYFYICFRIIFVCIWTYIILCQITILGRTTIFIVCILSKRQIDNDCNTDIVSVDGLLLYLF